MISSSVSGLPWWLRHIGVQIFWILAVILRDAAKAGRGR
jgi:hypothetical protein